MKNEIAALTREMRLLRKESGRVYDLLQKSSKIVEPTGNDAGDKHESAFLKGLSMDEERYRNIKNDLLAGNILDGGIIGYRHKVWPKGISSGIDAAWPCFDKKDFHSGQLAPDSFLLEFNNLKYLVELDPRALSAAVSSSSNTSESETAEPTQIGFVVECFNAMNYWDESEGRIGQAPLDFRTITAIAGLLTPPRAEAREAQRDAEHRELFSGNHWEFIRGYLNPWGCVFVTGYAKRQLLYKFY